MRDHNDLPYIVIERHSGGAGPFLWGALLGAGVALLLAPRSGAETQGEIRASVGRLRDAAEGRVNEVRDTVTGAVTRTTNRMYDRIDSVRGAVEAQADRARDAVETGRRAAREARSELERRMADARADYEPTGAGRRATQSRAPQGGVLPTESTVEESGERPELG